jgi:hypothetical protein
MTDGILTSLVGRTIIGYIKSPSYTTIQLDDGSSQRMRVVDSTGTYTDNDRCLIVESNQSTPPSNYPYTITPNTLVQLSGAGVTLIAVDYQIDLVGDVISDWRNQLRHHSNRMHPIHNHPAVLYMGPMHDDPGHGIFATHNGNVHWGFPLAIYEPFNQADHE